jgi:amidase
MDRTDLAFAGVVRQSQLVRAGEVTSRELVELYLERIERLQPELNCFSNVMSEHALAEAQQADARHGASDERPLLGVPIAVKEVHDVAGEVTTHGTAAHGNIPATEDSPIVARLRGAGAVIIGKTTTPELAIIGDTEGPAFGITRNPWNSDWSVAGSSGGSAAAVAAGLCAAATASDGAGSIRLPAANCGTFGLKPQRGRIGMTEHWHGLSVAGFATRDVQDTALLLDVAAASPPERSFAEAAARGPGALRIATSTRPAVLGRADSTMKRAVAEMAQLLRSLGHSVDEEDPAYGQAQNAITVRFLRGMADEARTMPHPDRLQRRTRGFARMGRAFPDGALAWARRQEEPDRERINRVFENHDVLLTPMTAMPPVRAGQWEGLSAPRTLLGMTAVYPYAVVWNMTGQPAASVPAGTAKDGRPIAVQLVGRPSDEATLLSLAAQIQAERRWAERRPPLA